VATRQQLKRADQWGASTKGGTPDRAVLAFCMLIHLSRDTHMTKLTKTKTDVILSSLADGHTIVDTCEGVGISRTAFYKLMKRDEGFQKAVRQAQEYSAEKALEELEGIFDDALHKRKDYDTGVLRDYAHHVRWKASKVMPDRFGDQKNRAGVEIGDGTVKILWETD
tara:strand:+ start:1002 stop:1502 length:501 start_codon:yes stop_codon:yes gene_type:complete